MFTRKQLMKLILPLIVEQFLAVAVGMADTIMITIRGEEAVSGISLVDTLNILLIGLFSALATGGAVVAAQYLGHKDKENAKKAANQLVLTVSVLSILLMTISLVANRGILHLIYGDLDPAIMKYARTYFYLTAASYPFIALYNAGAALFRAMGNSKVSMRVSIGMNAINIAGNAILIYGFGLSVEGAAIPTLVSRIIAAIWIMSKLRKPVHDISIDSIFHLGYEPKMIKRILRIGIPNGLENSVFQIGKILVSGLVASFGTVAIAANAVGNSVANFNCIPGSAIGLAMIPVVGQSVGAGDLKGAKKYIWKLMSYAYVAMILLNVIMILIMPQVVGIFHLSMETQQLATKILIYHCICCMFIWPMAFTLPNALRAANDVKYTMVISIVSMWTFRIALSYILAKAFGLGLFGIWIAMTVDWVFRAIFFVVRIINDKWKTHAYMESN